jgi:hypothetical protein
VLGARGFVTSNRTTVYTDVSVTDTTNGGTAPIPGTLFTGCLLPYTWSLLAQPRPGVMPFG